ncbi:MAG: CHRD domain-containing protein [Planctomycetes bacterium]|nr:CHRD domain-containing protein [Planctomycetota bacterium]
MLRPLLLLIAASLLSAVLPSQIQHFSARLTGDQEVPAVATAAHGWSIVTVNTATNQVDIFAYGLGLVATAAHLHQAAAGVNGPVVIPLAGGPQQWTGSMVAVPALIAAIQAGNTYVNLHSAANPGGQIRGQVSNEVTTRFLARLSGGEEVPPSGSAATGVMTAFLHQPGNVLVYELDVSGVVATAAHIHQAAAGVNGPVIVPLNGASPRWCGVSQRLSSAQLAALMAGGTYANVHSAAFPGGEIRGQLLLETADFAGRLNGAQEVPPTPSAGIGRACATLNANRTLTYRVEVTGLGAPVTAAHFHSALPGVNGPVVVPLVGGPPVWSGTSAVLTSAQVADLVAGRWYANVHSTAFPGGEIRGQMLAPGLPGVFGFGCPAAASTPPEIGSMGIACVGTNFTVALYRGPVAMPAVLLFGFSRDFMPGFGRLPLSLAPIGGTDCFLFHDNPGISVAAVTDALGCAKATIGIPSTLPGGGTVMAQWFAIAPGVNPLGVASSNGLEFAIN